MGLPVAEIVLAGKPNMVGRGFMFANRKGTPCNGNGGANYLIHYAMEGAVTDLLKRVAR